MTYRFDEDAVATALAGLEEQLEKAETRRDGLTKASEQDLDNPEGDDLDAGHMASGDGKLSDEPNQDEGGSGAAKRSPKAIKKGKGAADEAEDEEAGNDHEDEDEMTTKALSARADAEVQAQVDVSGFLKSLHDSLTESLEAMSDVVQKSSALHEERAKSLEAQIADLQVNQAKIGVVLKAMCEHIGMIGNQRARNGKATVQKGGGTGVAAEREFQDTDPARLLDSEARKSQALPGLSDNPIVAKSQMLDAMLDLAKSGKAEQTDVINLESNGFIRPEIVPLIRKSLTERAAAAQ